MTHRVMTSRTASNSTFVTADHDVAAIFTARFVICLILAIHSVGVSAEGSELRNAHGTRSTFLPAGFGTRVIAARRSRLTAWFDALDHVVRQRVTEQVARVVTRQCESAHSSAAPLRTLGEIHRIFSLHYGVRVRSALQGQVIQETSSRSGFVADDFPKRVHLCGVSTSDLRFSSCS